MTRTTIIPRVRVSGWNGDPTAIEARHVAYDKELLLAFADPIKVAVDIRPSDLDFHEDLMRANFRGEVYVELPEDILRL